MPVPGIALPSPLALVSAMPSMAKHAVKGMLTPPISVQENPDALLRELKHAQDIGQKTRLFIGCGRDAYEVREEAAKSKKRGRREFHVGIEPNGFSGRARRTALQNMTLFQGGWQLALHEARNLSLVDEINFVAPSGTAQDIERRIQDSASPILMLASGSLIMMDPEAGDFEHLYAVLKQKGVLNVYTENEDWAKDFAADLMRVFGLGRVTIRGVDPYDDSVPTSFILRKKDEIVHIEAKKV